MAQLNLKTCLKMRAILKGNMTRVLSFLSDNPDADIFELQARKEKLEEHFQKIQDVQLKIDLIADEGEDEALIGAQETERIYIENLYYKCARLINQCCEQLKALNLTASNGASSAPSQSNANAQVPFSNHFLPQIQIPPFDGNPLQWMAFRNAFQEVVHQSDAIPTCHKFYLLKSYLRGEIASVLDALTGSNEDYDVAWNLIKQRCEKPRIIINAHLQELFDIPALSKESSTKVRFLRETAEKHVNSLRLLDEPVDAWNAILVHVLTKKLDKITRRAWERSLDDRERPTFVQLIEFLTKQERGEDSDKIDSFSNAIQTTKTRSNRAQAFVTQQINNCRFCHASHPLYVCAEFLKLSPQERSKFIKQKNLCLNCLRDRHTTNNCRASGCKICGKKHNSLLHFPTTTATVTAAPNVVAEMQVHHQQERPDQALRVHTVTNEAEVLLGTAIIKILDARNREIECRVLLDSGAQSNFITEELAERLQLKHETFNIVCAGLGQLSTSAKFRVKTKIRSRTNKFERELSFVALPSLTGALPARYIERQRFEIAKNIQLADPQFNVPRRIDALIGATLYYQLLCTGQIKSTTIPGIVVQKTLLGWIVVGEVEASTATGLQCYLSSVLERQVKLFWELEEVPAGVYHSDEERICEAFYIQNTSRAACGRYVTKLPFNSKREKIGESYQAALKRYQSLERKLSKDNVLNREYAKFMREYIELGHMTDVTDSCNKEDGYFIPHHAVIKENNLSTKVRVVFDASAKSSTNISLNDALLVGPQLQPELLAILLRFRTHSIVMAADLQKMYRQVAVQQADRKYQQVLWRENTRDSIRVYELNTVTQGTSCAPYLATRTLLQLAADEGQRFPLAANALKEDFYVDDFLSGAESIEQATELKHQMTKLLKLGGFEMHKWVSNRPQILETKNDQSTTNISFDTESRKLLGVQWNTKLDTFDYAVSATPTDKHITKRTILSEISQIFDPLGLLGPVTVIAKLLIQDLWKLNVHWDESLSLGIRGQWLQFKNELKALSSLNLPRQIVLPDARVIELHGFCDASERAYGACVYLRSIDKNQRCSVILICAKSRVAPLKTVTLPRLELCSAVLLAKITKYVRDNIRVKVKKTIFWSDSTVALNQIKTPPHLLKTFVANRVAKIQTLTETNEWRHISTDENPADVISRGQRPSEFIHNKLWLHGPAWIAEPEENWREMQISNIDIPEKRIQVALIATVPSMDICERFSSFNRLIRFVARCNRLVNNMRTANKITGDLTVREKRDARLQILALVQRRYFSEEIRCTREGRALRAKSKLLCLAPFMDEHGILRVGGRLANADISCARKHPILLPKEAHVTRLIIRETHEMYWHASIQTTLNIVRNNYWPIDGKAITRNVISKCVRCRRFSPALLNYKMGNLPASRCTAAQPFDSVGLDYCGPFLIKEKKCRNRKSVKAYVAVFVCFATKAVHMELVSDLTAEACLSAIKRFCARRGQPRHIYSDNATNFVGAKNELVKIRAALLLLENNNVFKNYLSDKSINWHFSPPRAPHFGGLWEAAVKCFKRHLYRTLGKILLTYEQFNTCIVQIESVLNSRPLTPISTDSNDFSTLTPAHFLIGRDLTTVAEVEATNTPLNKLSNWQQLQKIKQVFWKRWHKEYLNQLITRSKWHQHNGDKPQKGMLVIIKEDNLPPMHWMLGRIIDLHPGEDGIVRVVTVKTCNGIYKRPVNKLAVLPVEV